MELDQFKDAPVSFMFFGLGREEQIGSDTLTLLTLYLIIILN